ncbi:unnamed protein product [Closterium sp. NIES-53]
MVPRRDLFTTYHSLPPNSRNVIVRSGDTLQAIGIGTITVNGKEGEVLNLKGVLHVPGLAANLLSCSQLARQEYICTFTMGGCTVRKGGSVVMEAKLEKDLLHLRMGHAGRQQLVECVKKGGLKGVEIKEGGGQPRKCPDCTTGKLPRTSFPTSTTRASAPLELVHTDICGPMQTPEREKGSKYFITFLDDFSRLSWVTLVKTKDEVAKVFKRWIRYAEREAGVKVKILSKGLEGKSPYFMWTRKVPSVSMARVWGCMTLFELPDQQRRKLDPKAQWGIFLGVSERRKAWMLWSVTDQRVVESRDVVFHEGQSYRGWKERGASTVGSSLQDPYTSSIFEGAWEDPGEEVQEQQEEQKAAAPHHEESPTAGSTPDPNAPAHDPEQAQGQQQQQQEKPQQPSQQHTPPVPVGRWQQLLQQQPPKSPRSPMKRVTWREKLQSLEQGEASPLRRTTRISQPPERFTPSAQYACMHDHEVHDLEECMLVDADGGAHGLDFCLMGQVHEPKSVKEALSRPEWVESMCEELESHKVNESFELVDPACVPPGMEVFTPVGKPTTLRGSLGMAASSGFHIHHMDVTTAYLHGVLKEEIYMRQPPDLQIIYISCLE